MLKCVKITSFFFVLLFELLPDTTSTVSGDCDFLRSCVNYKYIEKKKKKKKKAAAVVGSRISSLNEFRSKIKAWKPKSISRKL